MKALRSFLADERGTETLEWGLLCGLIIVGALTAIAVIGPKVTGIWDKNKAAVESAAGKVP
jgi:Flp pilus assembly pilin Flp